MEGHFLTVPSKSGLQVLRIFGHQAYLYLVPEETLFMWEGRAGAQWLPFLNSCCEPMLEEPSPSFLCLLPPSSLLMVPSIQNERAAPLRPRFVFSPSHVLTTGYCSNLCICYVFTNPLFQ